MGGKTEFGWSYSQKTRGIAVIQWAYEETGTCKTHASSSREWERMGIFQVAGEGASGFGKIWKIFLKSNKIEIYRVVQKVLGFGLFGFSILHRPASFWAKSEHRGNFWNFPLKFIVYYELLWKMIEEIS